MDKSGTTNLFCSTVVTPVAGDILKGILTAGTGNLKEGEGRSEGTRAGRSSSDDGRPSLRGRAATQSFSWGRLSVG